MKYSKGKYSEPNIWDQAKKLDMPDIDPGARFFVATLNMLGHRTEYSCEGHPNDFYVVFNASYADALAVKRARFFVVAIEGRDRWSVRITMKRTRQQRVDHLRGAAGSWAHSLLPAEGAAFIWSL